MLIDAPLKHRLLLSLRSEKAMGLRMVEGAWRRDVAVATEAIHVEEAASSKALFVRESSRSDALSGAQGIFTHASISTKAQAMPAAAVLSPAGVRDVSPITLPVLSTGEKTSVFAVMNEKEVSVCKKCRLGGTRTNTVFGEGDVDAKIFFVGEGPGENEDETGRPFVGRAGQLLDKMIGAMGLSRAQVFIGNIVKCRPPGNRVPAPDEVETCTPYLVRQLEIVRPTVIVTLGLPAVKYMLGDPKLTMGKTRGHWHAWRGIKLMPTYHPSYVLRAYTEANRAAVWGDLQMVMKEVGLETSRAKPKS